MRWVRSLITKHWVPPLLLPQSPQVDGWSADRCQDLCAFAMGNTSNPWCPRLMQFLVNGESWQVIYQSGGPGFGFNQGPKSRVCACFSNPKMTQSWSSGARKDFEDKLVPDLPFTDEFLGLLKFAQQNKWQSWGRNVVFVASSQGLFPISPCKYVPGDKPYSSWQITAAGHFVFCLEKLGAQVTKTDTCEAEKGVYRESIGSPQNS